MTQPATNTGDYIDPAAADPTGEPVEPGDESYVDPAPDVEPVDDDGQADEPDPTGDIT